MDYHNQAYELLLQYRETPRFDAMVKRVGDALHAAANPVWKPLADAKHDATPILVWKEGMVPQPMFWDAVWKPVGRAYAPTPDEDENGWYWIDLPVPRTA